jgi:hypothetical protein
MELKRKKLNRRKEKDIEKKKTHKMRFGNLTDELLKEKQLQIGSDFHFCAEGR